MIDARTPRRLFASAFRRRAAALLFTGILTAVAAVPAAAATAAPASFDAAATPAATSTANVMAADILSWLNRDRAAAGRRPLRTWATLASLATQRASNMSATSTLSHQAAGGNPGTAMTNAGIAWYSFGEAIGETSYPWGSRAASNLYSMWKNSAVHHAIMFSSSYNYIGIGIVRNSDGTTWSSILFSESPDHTRPGARNGSLIRRGTAIRFSWSGYDPALQTHTAGLRSFDIEYRMDNGPWHLIRNNTTGRALWLYNRPHRHYYSFRVQAADRRGNLSAWTSAKRVWVP